MTQTGTRRFCFPAFKRRIFFAAGLFFDISSTFSDSPDGRIAAALGQLGEDLLQGSITQWSVDGALFKHRSEVRFDGVGTLGFNHSNPGESSPGIRGEVAAKREEKRGGGGGSRARTVQLRELTDGIAAAAGGRTEDHHRTFAVHIGKLAVWLSEPTEGS